MESDRGHAMNDDQSKESHRDAHRHHGRGPSSYWMHDPHVVFGGFRLSPGETFLDLGCGPGDYAAKAAEIVGPGGKVIAVDASPAMISALAARAEQEGLVNLRTIVADITKPVALDDASVDVCFCSTVFHCFRLEEIGDAVFKEVRRILRTGGRMVVIECKKEALPFGPPLKMRLSAEEITAVAARTGFTTAGYRDLGYNYLVQFVLGRENQPTAIDEERGCRQ